MARFFTGLGNIQDGKIYITGEDVNHIKNVLRLRKDDVIVVCDGHSTDYTVKIEEILPDKVETTVISKQQNSAESQLDITLFQSILKSDKMDFVIQKATELGVKRIVPVITERTVVKLQKDKDKKAKVARWQKIAEGAAKQCQRGVIPEVAEIINFNDIYRVADGMDKVIIPYENNKDTGLKSVIEKGYRSWGIVIGPEGGFSEKEIKTALEKNIVPVTLGPRILRAETAGIICMAMISYDIGDMG